MSSTKIHKFLSTHPEARRCLTKMRKIFQERMTIILKDYAGRTTEDGDSLAVYTRVVN